MAFACVVVIIVVSVAVGGLIGRAEAVVCTNYGGVDGGMLVDVQ